MSRRRGPRSLRRLRKRVLRRIGLWLGPALIEGYVRLVFVTSRVEIVDRQRYEDLWRAGQGVLVAFWHGRLLMMPPLLRRGFAVDALVSEHRDGEIIVRALERFGLGTIRGSSTRGGRRGLRELVRRVRAGHVVAITPDGPRGPACEAKPGAVFAARLVGAPLVPVSYSSSRARFLRTWDGAMLPFPFGRLVYTLGEPMQVPRDARPDELARLRVRLGHALREMTARADAAAGVRRTVDVDASPEPA